MEEPVHYLILLLLQFDGTLVKEVIEFIRPTTLWECLEYSDQHREAISIYRELGLTGQAIDQGWYLNDGSGTWQGVICTTNE
jgi:hypothetical protein|tara:strand:+ start:414 stop:659 length:246 start_codon:yes stop_codon:yes gene_type:complete